MNIKKSRLHFGNETVHCLAFPWLNLTYIAIATLSLQVSCKKHVILPYVIIRQMEVQGKSEETTFTTTASPNISENYLFKVELHYYIPFKTHAL